ncbi:hypothetical protein Tco_0574069 [Tanacetum coccineum]
MLLGKTPMAPKALSGSVDIEKEILYDAKRVTWDLTYGYLTSLRRPKGVATKLAVIKLANGFAWASGVGRSGSGSGLCGSVDIEKEIFYDAKRVTWDLTYGYLRVTFPFDTTDTMLQGPFSVPWAPNWDPTIEKALAADGARRSSKDGAEQSMEQEAGNEKADQDDGHEKKDGGPENVDGSGTI